MGGARAGVESVGGFEDCYWDTYTAAAAVGSGSKGGGMAGEEQGEEKAGGAGAYYVDL